METLLVKVITGPKGLLFPPKLVNSLVEVSADQEICSNYLVMMYLIIYVKLCLAIFNYKCS